MMDDSAPAPKPSPRGRPAKPSSGSLLGKRIEVMWDAEDGGKEYYAGKVTNEDATRVKVAYDDGEKKWHPLDGLIYKEVIIV